MRCARPPHTLLLAALLLLHLLLATAYSLWNPLGEAPDEVDHWAYVVYLAHERRLPEGPRVTQSKHPPLYHATAAAVASLAEPDFGFLRANPDASVWPAPGRSLNFFIHTATEAWPWQGGARAFHLARLWSVLISTATIAAIYGLGRTAFPAHPGVWLLGAGIAAALPEFAFIGGAINNDNAAALLGTLALWGGFAIYRAGGSWRAGWWTPLALGLGLLAKVSTSSLWPVVGLLIVAGAARGQGWRGVLRTRSRWVGSGLVIFLPALGIAAPWLLRNWRLYGDPTGMALVVQTIDLRVTSWRWDDTTWLLRGWFLSFWGKFGAAGHIPFPLPVYVGLGLLTLVGVLGLGQQFRRGHHERVAALYLGLAGLAVAAGMVRYSLLALGTDQGRLLFPALGPICLLLAWGLAGWPWGRTGTWAGSMLVLGLAGLAVYGLVGVIRPAFAPPAPPTDAELAGMTRPAEPIVLGEMVLEGWTLADGPVLYWVAPAAPTQDWRVLLRVTAADGSLVHEQRRSPGYGRFSTDHWPAQTRQADAYIIPWPDWAGPGRYRIEVTAYPYGTGPGPLVEIGWIER